MLNSYTVESIKANLTTLIIGRRIELHPLVLSTNDLVKDAARQGEPEGLVVLAEEQVQGRGRLGRTWTAPPGSSILCSVLLRPRFSPEQAFYLTIAAALAIYRAVGGITADEGSLTADDGNAEMSSAFPTPHSAIKWPNDVLVNGRKVSGVLSESEFSGREWAFAVVGFGVNVNLDGEELDGLRSVAPQATSLSHEMGSHLDRAKLLSRILGEFEALYLALQGGQFGPVFDAWERALETVGKQVAVREAGGVLRGRALRVDSDGALVVRTEAGVLRRILAGDVDRLRIDKV